MSSKVHVPFSIFLCSCFGLFNRANRASVFSCVVAAIAPENLHKMQHRIFVPFDTRSTRYSAIIHLAKRLSRQVRLSLGATNVARFIGWLMEEGWCRQWRPRIYGAMVELWRYITELRNVWLESGMIFIGLLCKQHEKMLTYPGFVPILCTIWCRTLRPGLSHTPAQRIQLLCHWNFGSG